jgi:hypothetical protein
MKLRPGTNFAFALIFFSLFSTLGIAQDSKKPIEGRWDLTIDRDGKRLPAWLEVKHSGIRTLVGRYVGPSGSARPISEVKYNDGKFTFSIPPQWERAEKYSDFEGQVDGETLKGTIVGADGKTYNWVGSRAPSLQHDMNPKWGKPVQLLNGKDLAGWHATGVNQWVIEGGVLKSAKPGSNLVTDNTYMDFKLHVEFKCPKGSNSGVYLRGRYEVQITDSKGMEPSDIYLGAVYGFLVPNEMAAKDAGEWQSYDITLIGRRVTIVANGKAIINDQTIPGITGGALDSKEGEPGPILLQGDHEPIEYRNIVITPAMSGK